VALLALAVAATTCSKTGPCTLCGSPVCVDTKVDSANCGGCGITCAAGTRCEQGQCSATCAGLVCGGSCVESRFDPNNCGGCGVVCGAPHTAPTCVDGGCVQGLCDDGWYDCDFNPRTGCESQVRDCKVNLCPPWSDGGARNCKVLSVSGDGGLVAFDSADDGLVSEDTNRSDDLFLLETGSRRLRWLTRSGDGGIASDGGRPPLVGGVAISADGTRVAFVTSGGLFDPDPNLHIYRLDLKTDELRVLRNDIDAGLELWGWSVPLSSDGRFMATNAYCTAGDFAEPCLLRFDWETGDLVRKLVNADFSGNAAFALSGDGRTLGYVDFFDSHHRVALFDVNQGTERLALDLSDAGPTFQGSETAIALDFDATHVALFLPDIFSFNVVVAGPSGILTYSDGGIASFAGEYASLSADGRVLGLMQGSGGSLCGAIDLSTGQLLALSVSDTGWCPQPLLTGDGRHVAASVGSGLLLMDVNRP
jgi:hypothetical protein